MTAVLFLLSWFLSSICLTQCVAFGNSTASPTAATTTTIDNSTVYWGKVYPDYVPLSSDQAGDCNIFGLLCQTGTVTVGVNLTSTTTTTVIPCSSYLSAQANWIAPDGTEYNDYNTGVDGLSWLSSFGRSPECTSFAKAGFPDYAFSSAPAPVLSNCLDNGTDLSTNPQAYLPPGVNNFRGGHYYDCCDQCILNAPQVRVIYFPDPEAPPCQQANLKNNSISAVASLPITLSGAQKRSGAPVTAVVSGYTFTSPTIYLQVVGTADVSDSCGPRGAQYTNPIIALPSGALSSYSWNVPVGGSFTYQNNFVNADATKAVEVTDLACPSWGFASTTAADGSALVGPPFNPLIEPPQELLSLDPQWLKCEGFEVNRDHLISWVIYEPPIALISESGLRPFSFSSQPALAPKITSAVSVAVSQIPPASPVQTSHVLQPTSLPPASTSISTSAVVPTSSALADLEPSVSLERSPSTNPGQISPNLAEYSFDPSVLYHDSSASSIAELGQTSQDPEHSSTDPSALLDTSTASFATTTGLNLGAIIYSAFGGAPTTSATDPNTNTESVVITVGGVVLTANPSLNSLANTVITEGGPAGTVGGTAISIGQFGVVFGSSIITFPTPTSVITNSGKSMPTGISFTANADSSTTIDGSTLVIGSNVATVSGEVFTVGGELISANPTALVVAGSTLTAGDPAITVAGTPISLGLSSFAVIGGSSINLDPPGYSTFAIKGQTFTANPSALVVSGSTLTPGGAAITVAGVPISLAPSDIAVIGSSTINLDPPGSLQVFTAAGQTFTANPSAISIDGTIITAGGPGVVVSGTPVSLESGGILLLGTSLVDLNSSATEATGGTGMITPYLGLGPQSRVEALGFVKMAWMVGLVGLLGLL